MQSNPHQKPPRPCMPAANTVDDAVVAAADPIFSAITAHRRANTIADASGLASGNLDNNLVDEAYAAARAVYFMQPKSIDGLRAKARFLTWRSYEDDGYESDELALGLHHLAYDIMRLLPEGAEKKAALPQYSFYRKGGGLGCGLGGGKPHAVWDDPVFTLLIEHAAVVAVHDVAAAGTDEEKEQAVFEGVMAAEQAIFGAQPSSPAGLLAKLQFIARRMCENDPAEADDAVAALTQAVMAIPDDVRRCLSV